MGKKVPRMGITARHWRRIKAANVAADMNYILYGSNNVQSSSMDVINSDLKLDDAMESMDSNLEVGDATYIPQQEDGPIFLPEFHNTDISLAVVESLQYDGDTDTNSDSEVDNGNKSDSDFEWDDAQVPVDQEASSDNTTFPDESFSGDDHRLDRSKKTQKLLSLWALTYGISHKALNGLLTILSNQTDLVLPRDSSTLLKTPRNVKMIDMSDDAKYCHFGLIKSVEEIGRHYLKHGIVDRKIRFLFNIDGLPIYKSSEKSLWLILCSDTLLKKVYIVGMYIGARKPKDPNQFLDYFVNELQELCSSKQSIDGQDFEIYFHALVCDAPTKSMVLNTADHSGYNSCSKCTQEGTWEVPKGRKVQRKGRVCFPFEENPCNVLFRTDEDFAINAYRNNYQHGCTSLLRIPGFLGVTRVPLDCMHLVMLGVMKRLIHLWLQGSKTYRLGRQDVENITQRLLAISKSTPIEFPRRPRDIRLFHFWKATEFRSFLLYTGPVVLKGILQQALYDNFIHLHAAIRILIDRNLVKFSENIDSAEQLIVEFVKGFQNIYGKEQISHNIHNLLHLSADVRIFGPLDDFSAFRFENYMTLAKRHIRKYDNAVQQINKRSIQEIAMGDKLNDDVQDEPPLRDFHKNGPVCKVQGNVIEQYKRFVGDNFQIDCRKEKDSAICLKGRVLIKVLNIVKCCNEEIFLIGQEYNEQRDLYVNPLIDSSELFITVSKNTNLSEMKAWPLTLFYCKMWQMPIKDGITVHSAISHCTINNKFIASS